jgi:hypothetical protein
MKRFSHFGRVDGVRQWLAPMILQAETLIGRAFDQVPAFFLSGGTVFALWRQLWTEVILVKSRLRGFSLL